ncbi:DEAD/DEAH box helicase, partial [Opisthorchis viverrini]
MQPSMNPRGFQSLGVLPDICDILNKLGWSEPTPIQHNAIPVALKDLIGIAETGSGKTGAFIIPIIQQWILAGRPRGFALLLAPTRELAQQLATEAYRLSSPQTSSVSSDEGLRVVQLVGGEDMVEQALRLAWHKHHIIVATPGRLVDHMKQSASFTRQQLSQIRQLVLDEADRMLSMEFAQDLDTILNVFKRPNADKKRRRKRMKSRRLLEQVANTGDCLAAGPTQTVDSEKFPHPQTHLYSATMTSDVAKLRRAALSADACVLGGDHASKCVDAQTKDHSLSSQVRFPPGLVHYCLPVRLVDKPAILNWILEGATLSKLHEVCPSQLIAGESLIRSYTALADPVSLQSCSSTRTIVFCKRCQEVRLVTAFLRESGHCVVGLTGRMKQVDRKNALKEFVTRNANILVATDVASRGLDLPGVELVVNFSVPQSEKTYRHRVGRTARAGRSGIAVTLVTRDVASVFLDLEASVAPHLPKTGADEKDNIFPRWPVPLPQPSGKQGMLVRRRLADLAWTRAGKIVRAEDMERRRMAADSLTDSDSSDVSVNHGGSLGSFLSASESSEEEFDNLIVSVPTEEPTVHESVALNVSGEAGVHMARASWISLHKEKKLRKKKRRVIAEEKRQASAVGWGLAAGDDLANDEEQEEQDHLRFEETLRTKYTKAEKPNSRKPHGARNAV